MKTCSKCDKPKELSCFYDNKQNRDGKTGMCIECVRAYQKQRYESLAPDKKKEFVNIVISNRLKSKQMRFIKLRCRPCFNANVKKYWQDGKRRWENVDVISKGENHILCECKNCGHKYKSKSKMAFRLWNIKTNE